AAIHSELGQALLQLKRFVEADKEYRLVADLKPNDPYLATLPLRTAAFSASTEPDYQLASDGLQKALTANPEDDALRAELAGLHIPFSRFEPARRELTTILGHNPTISADCWLNLRTVYLRLGDKSAADAASAQFRRVIDLKRTAESLTEECQLRPG